jgi:transcriptional regulator with XRE-family HTH domain
MAVDLTHPERAPAEMSGPELKAIRAKLKLSAVMFGRALGYSGADSTVSVMISKYESGGRPIPVTLGRLAKMFDLYQVPSEFILGAPPPKMPARKPMVIDRDVLRSLADLDLEPPKK